MRVALVAIQRGKSTLMNLLSKSEYLPKTNSSQQSITTVPENGTQPALLLTDTSVYPQAVMVVQSFQSPRRSPRGDILLHIVDVSHPGFEEQIEVVQNTLEEIKAGEKKTIYVFNKIDAFSFVEKDQDDLTERTRENRTLDEWKNSWMAKNNTPSVFISAKEKTNIEVMKQMLYEEVKSIHITRFPYNDFLFPNEPEIPMRIRT